MIGLRFGFIWSSEHKNTANTTNFKKSTSKPYQHRIITNASASEYFRLSTTTHCENSVQYSVVVVFCVDSILVCWCQVDWHCRCRGPVWCHHQHRRALSSPQKPTLVVPWCRWCQLYRGTIMSKVLNCWIQSDFRLIFGPSTLMAHSQNSKNLNQAPHFCVEASKL